jgi:1,4-dihydroxy-2-naphthoate octaprenyltransferase
MPVIFGTVLAVTVGGAEFHALRFLAAFFGMAFLHTGANLLNDAFDFKKGLDNRVNPVSGAVVRGWITPGRAVFAASLFLAAGCTAGLWLYWAVGTPILWLGAIGVAIGVLYSLGPLGLKYHALGDLAVFLNFGILGALGAWTVQTGSLWWTPAVWAIPMSLLVIGILHANNWRDIESDSAGGIRTVASLLGDRASEAYYGFLVLGPFAVTLGIIAFSRLAGLGPPMPLSFLLTLVSLPIAIGLMRKGRRRRAPKAPLDFLALDGATAQLNLAFGLLCTAALGLDQLLGACCHG